jgi:glycolate oxidase iron-sulfur subunit
MELEQELVSDCVHCGFCLSGCPTYVLWHEEMDSPRGRIQLMQQRLDGTPMTDTMAGHFDRCLGCLACVTSCPSGVKYDQLLEATRIDVEREHPRTRAERLLRAGIFALFPYPRRLRIARWPLWAYQRSGLERLIRRSGLLERLPATPRALAEIAPPVGRRHRLPTRIPAQGERRATVGLLTGCVQDAFFSDVNAATARVLAAEGCDVIIPSGQSCCGALSGHGGREELARQFARRTIATFEAAGVDTLVVNAAGCGSAIKEYGRLLADDPAWADRANRLAERTRDLTELLVRLGPRATRHPVPLRVAYQDACHLRHAQGVRDQPRTLLRGIPGLELAELAEPDLCCGSAGIYNLVQPQAARELGDRKVSDVLATRADLLVTGNPGCLLQISSTARRRGADLAVAATASLLDASIRDDWSGLPAQRPPAPVAPMWSDTIS